MIMTDIFTYVFIFSASYLKTKIMTLEADIVVIFFSFIVTRAVFTLWTVNASLRKSQRGSLGQVRLTR